jgi:hypothetical protein
MSRAKESRARQGEQWNVWKRRNGKIMKMVKEVILREKGQSRIQTGGKHLRMR